MAVFSRCADEIVVEPIFPFESPPYAIGRNNVPIRSSEALELDALADNRPNPFVRRDHIPKPGL